MLDELKKFNDFLEGVPLSVTKFFKATFKSGEEFAQSYVDAVCRWAAWRVNKTIEVMRQWLIRALWKKYGSALSLLAAGQKVKKAITNPIKFIGDVLGELFKPFVVIQKFITTFAKELIRLAKNLAEIMSVLPPEPPDPRINYDEFKLKVHTISMKEVLAGPEALPSPDEMFPEPPKPWSKATFNASFSDAKDVISEDRPFFKLPEKESGVKVSGGISGSDTTIA